MNTPLHRLKKLGEDPFFVAVFFLSFVMVFVKKWEPGGNLDTVWYSAVAKNIALTGDYTHFFISKYYFSSFFDHMPLMYWIIATLFKIFGVSDFVARLYPMFCSFFSYLLVYWIGVELKDKEFGLITLLSYVACFGASKWNGAVMHDVPLTVYLLASFYTFLVGRRHPKYWYLTALFFALGVFTKGPIILGLPLGIFLWSLWERNFFYLKEKKFYLALGLTGLLLLLPLLPGIRFNGLNAYQAFLAALQVATPYKKKVSFLEPRDLSNYFNYFTLLLQTGTILVIPFFTTFWLLAKKKAGLSEDSNRFITLCLFVALAIIFPLSLFKAKYPHYLLPFYPFYCLFAAPSVYWFYHAVQRRYVFNFPRIIRGVSLVALCAFVALPIKTTGGRAKAEMNLANLIKFDSDIKNKDVYFYGSYEDNMIIFQTFKFYGSIDLRALDPADFGNVDLKKSYVIIKKDFLPVDHGIEANSITEKDCFLQNESLCVVTDPTTVSYTLPVKALPHEVY